MLQYLTKSVYLLIFIVVIVCGIYPFVLWTVGQTIFPFQANGSILMDAAGKPVGSKLIAQAFTKDEYFQPRPSAASYDATASSSSALAASNYVLRDRIARAIGPIAQYQNGQAVAPDVEKWFAQDKFQDKPHIVAQWATMHNSLAQAWVTADPSHASYVDAWAKNNPSIPQLKAADLAVTFFQNFSTQNPGKFPLSKNGDIAAIFFDMWRHDHPNIALKDIPGDLVTASGSGLDPHISLSTAEFQLQRVASKWASNLKRDPVAIHNEIQTILHKNAQAPLAGLAGESFINVLEVNLELHKKYT